MPRRPDASYTESLAARKGRWSDPAFLFLLLGFFSGLLLVFMLPPFQVADEWRHFYRAYQLAGGTLFGYGIGDEMPKNLHQLVRETDEFLGMPTRTPQPPAEILAFLKRMAAIHINPENTYFVPFPTVLYTPVPYAGMTAAIALGQWWTESPLVLMYLGRLGGFVAALALSWQAIRLVPFGKWAFFLMAMTPVVAYQRAGMSADSFINALAMLYTALILDAACNEDKNITTTNIIWVGIVTVALCLCKQAYMIMPFFAWIIPAKRFRRPRDCYWVRFWIPVIGWAVAGTWAVMVLRTNYEPMVPGCDAVSQVKWILTHPVRYAGFFLQDLLCNGYKYLHELIGTLGWLDLPASGVLVLGHAAVLVISSCCSTPPQGQPTLGIRLWTALVFSASTVFVWTLMYLWWAPVGSAVLLGMQGRYFTPLLPLLPAILAIPRQLRSPFPNLPFLKWPFLYGTYGLLLSLETLIRVCRHHYQW